VHQRLEKLLKVEVGRLLDPLVQCLHLLAELAIQFLVIVVRFLVKVEGLVLEAVLLEQA
jgi:hypothetical protein